MSHTHFPSSLPAVCDTQGINYSLGMQKKTMLWSLLWKKKVPQCNREEQRRGAIMG